MDEAAVIINLVTLQSDIAAEDFAAFSAEVDRPIWLAQEVVKKFEVFQVAAPPEDENLVQFVELIEVSSLADWERVSQDSPIGKEMAAAFESLADSDAVRTIITSQI